MWATAKRVPLNLDELVRAKSAVLCCVALVALWTVLPLGVGGYIVAAFSSFIVVTVLVRPEIGRRLPGWFWKVSVPAVTLFFAIDMALTELIPALVRLNILLVTLRLLGPRGKREDLQLVLLCLFLVIVAGVLTVSFFFAVQILLFAVFGLAALFTINLVDTADRQGLNPSAFWARLGLGFLIRRLWEVADLRIIGMGALLFAGMMTFSSFIFFVMPRFHYGRSLSFLSFGREQTFTGFSSTIALGEVTDIKQDLRMAMRVDVSSSKSLPPIPYWRMVVLDEYHDGVFRVSSSVRRHLEREGYATNRIASGWALNDRYPVRGTGQHAVWTFYLEGGISRYLPLTGNFDDLTFRDTRHVVVNPYFRTIATVKPPQTLVSYQVTGMQTSGRFPDPGLERNLQGRSLSNGIGSRNQPLRPMRNEYPDTLLETPQGERDQKVLRSAVRAIRGGRQLDVHAFAERACRYLVEHHRYALSVSVPNGPGLPSDVAVRWMDSRLPGHCEFFTAALILLAREAGIPARAVTGFKGGSWNGFENYYMVRNADAHAWCELYDPKGYWFRVDPTPGTRAISATGTTPVARMGRLPVDRTLNAYLDGLRMIWYRRVVSFDRASQVRAVRSLRDWVLLVRDASQLFVQESWSGFVAWLKAPWSSVRVTIFVVIGCICTGLVILLRNLGIGNEDLLLFFKSGEGPVRQRASQYLRKIENRRRIPSTPEFESERENVLRSLERLRFGSPHSWPAPRKIFRKARRLLGRR